MTGTRQKIINLCGGPGSGKSTGAAYIFSQLKMRNINCELVVEYAKSRVWQNDLEVFQNQLYVIGKQSLYQSRLKGKVEVIITDSPIFMGAFYAHQLPYFEHFKEVLKAMHQEYESFDCFIKRVKPYNPKGRFQDEDGAKKIDDEIKKLYETNNIGLREYSGCQEGYDQLVNDWLEYYHKL